MKADDQNINSSYCGINNDTLVFLNWVMSQISLWIHINVKADSPSVIQ